MKKNILTDNFIDPKKLHFILLFFFSALSFWMLWEGINQYSEINHFLSEKTFSKQNTKGEKLLKVGEIILTKTGMQYFRDSTNASQGKLYASILNLDHQTPDAQKRVILSNHRVEKMPIYGLSGAPSFIVKSDTLSFWRSQLYLETLVNFGGLFVLSLIYIVIYESKYQKENKLFITPVKNSILTAGFLLMAGVFIKWGLNYRLVHFLNEHFYISHLQSHMPSSLYYIACPVLILGIWLDQAVRLQKEQDLTI